MFGHKEEMSENPSETLKVIQELMEQLVGEMKPGASDFEERLGRGKPDMMAVKIEGKMDPEMAEEMGEGEMPGMPEEPESPDDKLKKRLMSLRA